ncbi:hypothetical protein PAGU2595_001870 [Lysobacter xanthus]
MALPSITGVAEALVIEWPSEAGGAMGDTRDVVGARRMTRYQGSTHVDLADPVALRDLGRVVIALLEKWGLSAEQQLALLASKGQSVSTLQQLNNGDCSLPPAVLQRFGHLIGIHGSLRLLFPEDKELRFSWIWRRNLAFDGLAPIDIMLRDGADGIARVWAVLDQQCMQ